MWTTFANVKHHWITEKLRKKGPIHCNSCCVALCCVLFSPPFCALCECGLYSPPKIPCYIIHASSSLDDSLSRFFRRHFFQCSNVSRSAREGTFPRFSPKGFEKPRIEWVSPPWHLGFSVGNFRDPCKNGNPLMVSFEYYSHKNPLKIWITLLVRSGMNDEGVFFCEKSGRFLLGKNVSFFAGLHYFWMAGLWMVR